MSQVIIAGDTSGTITLQAPAVSGSTTLTLPATTATLATLTTPSFASTIGVGGATASASGAGISFPATQSASSDANTLDDYEEGTWTPTVTPSGGSLTSYTSSGTYTKIGRSVYVSFTFVITNAGTASGTATIGGFPFTNLLSSQQLGLTKEIVATGTAYIVVINFNASTGVIRTFTNGAITWTNTYEYNSSLTYVAT
jgi:hypothetical protein